MLEQRPFARFHLTDIQGPSGFSNVLSGCYGVSGQPLLRGLPQIDHHRRAIELKIIQLIGKGFGIEAGVKPDQLGNPTLLPLPVFPFRQSAAQHRQRRGHRTTIAMGRLEIRKGGVGDGPNGRAVPEALVLDAVD